MLIDSHCHINLINKLLKIYNIDYILKKIFNNNNISFLNVCVDLKDSYYLWKNFNKYKNIYYSCGIHPNNIHKYKYDINDLIYYSSKNYISAIGETGLDYYNKINSKKKIIQQNYLLKHIFVSNFLKKPIIIHCRNSFNDVLKIFKFNKLDIPGIWHCFNGNTDLAKNILDNNFYISFSGIITFKNSIELQKVVKYVPINKILVETDSPYLSPEPFRGKINYPFNIKKILNIISILKNININYLIKNIKKNFFNIIKKNKNLNK